MNQLTNTGKVRRLLKKHFLRHSLTAAAKAGTENEPAIAALKRCATQNQVQHRVRPQPARSVFARRQHGFTLIELIVATAILAILVGAAFPLVRITIYRERERELRQDLWMIRDAIDRYKDAAERNAFQIKVGSEGYPPDLDTLVTGVDVAGKKLKFLRRIPVDPMTKQEWGMRSMQDDKDSDSWGGQNVFDVYTKSDQVALDGTKYKDW
jgi:general secretion pathway protein G